MLWVTKPADGPTWSINSAEMIIPHQLYTHFTAISNSGGQDEHEAKAVPSINQGCCLSEGSGFSRIPPSFTISERVPTPLASLGHAAAELATIAEQKHVTLSQDLGPHAGLKSRLEKLQGAAFDRAYIAAMVEDHTKAVKAFETASKSSDADIKSPLLRLS
jgi:hypothetical protein